VVPCVANWSNTHSNMLRIDLVVFCVCANESNVQHSIGVIDVYNQSVLVTANIENNAITLKEARIPVSSLDVVGTIPGGL